MPGRSTPGRKRESYLGQHFLANGALARRLAHDADIAPSDLVVEFGAGPGVLTSAVAERGARVLALELDPQFVAELVRRFRGSDRVTVFGGDALAFPLPATRFRVFANPPFNRTSAILHRLLDDPSRGLVRADLVVQWQVARARTQAGNGAPLDLVGAAWGPWWVFRRGRRLPATLFRPSPSVDAAVLIVERRASALLPEHDAARFHEFVRSQFGNGSANHSVEDWSRLFRARPGEPA